MFNRGQTRVHLRLNPRKITHHHGPRAVSIGPAMAVKYAVRLATSLSVTVTLRVSVTLAFIALVARVKSSASQVAALQVQLSQPCPMCPACPRHHIPFEPHGKSRTSFEPHGGKTPSFDPTAVPEVGQMRLQNDYLNYLLDDLEHMHAASSEAAHDSALLGDPSSLKAKTSRGDPTATAQKESVGATGIPKNLIFNSKDKDGVCSRDGASNMLELCQNVERIKALNPGWGVIFDDDAGCLEKTMATGVFRDVGRRRVAQWYEGAPGRLRSDLCRLAQLDAAGGGVYMDNDLELVQPLDTILSFDGDTFVSVWSAPLIEASTGKDLNQNVVFQALMASAQGSPVVVRGLELFRDHISGVRLVRHHDLGTALMGQALKDVLARTRSVGDPEGVAAGASPGDSGAGMTGIRMFRELPLTSQELAQMRRREDGSCNMAVKMWREGEGGNRGGVHYEQTVSGGEGGGHDEGSDVVVAFSRVVMIGDPSVSCKAGHRRHAGVAAERSTRRGKRPAGAGDDSLGSRD